MKQNTFFFLFLILLASCSAPKPGENSIVAENHLPGTTDWLISVKCDSCGPPNHRYCRRPQIEGYCSETSVAAGDSVNLYISTNPVSRFTIEIYRMGYYQGKGGTLKKSIGPLQGKVQVNADPDPKTNFVECKWDASYQLVIPPDWLSGVYLCKLTTLPDHFQSYIIFIVKDKRKVDFLFQCSDLTWQCYNRWPYWHSMYDEGHNPWINTNGAKVSFDRPYALYVNELPSGFNPLSNGSGEFLLWEYPLCFWMEKEGYDVSYISDLDTHADSTELFRAKGYLSVGHDEYWTYDMFNNVIRARDKGVNLLFLSGNAVNGTEWLAPSTDNRPNRTTGRLPERLFSNEQELLGASSYGVGYGSFICRAPDHWIFANTGMKENDSILNLVGWEYHGRPAGHQRDLVVLAETKPDPLSFGAKNPQNYISTIYTAAKGNFVFNAGTCWWVQPLARTPAYPHPMKLKDSIDFSKPDPRVQQMTRNLLNRVLEE